MKPKNIIMYSWFFFSSLLGILLIYITKNIFLIDPWITFIGYLMFLILLILIGAILIGPIEMYDDIKWNKVILVYWSYKVKVKFNLKILQKTVEINNMLNWLDNNIKQENWIFNEIKDSFLFRTKQDAIAFKIMFGEYCDA